MRFNRNLSENRFCYLKKASRYYYSHSLLHTPISDFGYTDVAAFRSLICRSFDHRSCGFLSITSLEPWNCRTSLPQFIPSAISGRHAIRLLSSSSLPQSFSPSSQFHPVFSRFSPLLYIPRYMVYIYQITPRSSEWVAIGRRASKNWYRETYTFSFEKTHPGLTPL